MPLAAAIEQIEVNLGKQFDLNFGRRFIELAQSNELDGIIGHSDTGIPMHECPMCGPVVVVHKNQKVGDKVFSRVCGTGFALEKQQGKLALKPTMQKSNAADLQALIDHDLLARLLDESLPYLPVDNGRVQTGCDVYVIGCESGAGLATTPGLFAVQLYRRTRDAPIGTE